MKLRELWDVFLLFITLLVIFITASQNFGLTWDETIYFDFSASIKEWFMRGPSFDEGALNHYWAYDSFANPHPPVMKILSAITSLFTLPWLGFPTNYRLGHFLFNSFSLSLVYFLLRGRFLRVPSLCAVGCIVLQPRLFGHLLNGGVDSPVAMAWLVLPLLSWEICRQETVALGKKEMLFCILYSFAVATKFTGLLILIPVSMYFILLKQYKRLWLSFGAFVVALFFLLVVSPEKWFHPVRGLWEYIVYPFTRETVPIETFYFWKTYPFFLPWHYFDVMVFFALPAILWILLPGLVFSGKKDISFLLALLLPTLFWVLLGHYPKTPKHDVVRQFVSIFPLLGVLCWFALFLVLEYFMKKRKAFTSHMRNGFLAFPVLILLFGLVSAHP
ncbi:MAG: glycosyltransferase family 39 protein, partial [Nitrospinota bacterium]